MRIFLCCLLLCISFVLNAQTYLNKDREYIMKELISDPNVYEIHSEREPYSIITCKHHDLHIFVSVSYLFNKEDLSVATVLKIKLHLLSSFLFLFNTSPYRNIGKYKWFDTSKNLYITITFESIDKTFLVSITDFEP